MNSLLTLLPELQPNLEANDASIASILWFLKGPHNFRQTFIESDSVMGIVRPTVTICTDGGHPAGMIWTSVREAPYVMWLKVWLAVYCEKWSRQVAAFAYSPSTPEYILPNRFASAP